MRRHLRPSISSQLFRSSTVATRARANTFADESRAAYGHQQETRMKKTIVTIAAFLACGFATAAEILPQQALSNTLQGLSASGSAPIVEAAGRKGSKRVGGSGRSGKGGRYVGVASSTPN
jgi:hypothetical protein